jgi:catalase
MSTLPAAPRGEEQAYADEPRGRWLRHRDDASPLGRQQRRALDADRPVEDEVVVAVDPDSAAAEKALAFDPTNLPDGIELSDDTLPALRSKVYAKSVERRSP